jgi:hypothetical protein
VGHPPPGHLVGVWAGVVRRLWDLSLDWWKVLAEAGAVEDRGLVPGSVSTFVPITPRAQILEVANVRTAEGPVLPASVTVKPDRLGPGSAGDRVPVVVSLQLPKQLRAGTIVSLDLVDVGPQQTGHPSSAAILITTLNAVVQAPAR